MDRVQINIRCTADLLRRMDAYLAGEGSHFRSRSDLIRYAVLVYLDSGGRLSVAAKRTAPQGGVVEAALPDSVSGVERPNGSGIDTRMIDDGFLEDFG